MGRKGIGKLAALSVSHNVKVMTISNGDKSGFILSRTPEKNDELSPIQNNEIIFNKIKNNGTSIVMTNPEYKLPDDLNAQKQNLLKIFSNIDKKFKIHIFNKNNHIIFNLHKTEIISDLAALMTFGKDFDDLNKDFKTELKSMKKILNPNNKIIKKELLLKNNNGNKQKYNLKINGWIGAYRTTKNRKDNITDFQDNFLSIFSNGKLGEFNIIPIIGHNRLNEVYVVGQLHIDLFEETDLPDMALSNRQGYKSDDDRYQEAINLIQKKIFEKITNLRKKYADEKNRKKKEEIKIKNLKKEKKEISELNNYVLNFIDKLSVYINENSKGKNVIFKPIIEKGIDENLSLLKLKKLISSQEKKILISHSKNDKDLGDIIYQMLIFNGVPANEILYTSSEDEKSRIPEISKVYNYLKDFFVNSFSNQKIYVLFVTSEKMSKEWNSIIEVGAAWITQSYHIIFKYRETLIPVRIRTPL
jgi:hypothetical protein